MGKMQFKRGTLLRGVVDLRWYTFVRRGTVYTRHDACNKEDEITLNQCRGRRETASDAPEGSW